MCIIWVSGPSSSCSLIRANASSDLFPMGIVIAARELGKSDFLSVGHDFSMRKNVGKKWVCLLKSVGKVESNKVFCGAVEEEEGGEKLVGRYDRYWYSASIAGVVAGLRPNWYNLFQVALQAYFLSVQDEKICVI
ncbi:hypothetical protein L249_5653 [Ophiocordyceps polyrhachis-furcata BCC 54312]|uniref:Uncharacterized protein n=1 Tax=Ophiocordyceps polyrhachis-furcata BCC 54312 TaxID=1330021 RepID=A0A367LGC0_9HYPO|nr:hypothetical protein L249_5653 [Ophiocordyceps polyrhachis-furcata BCC 54312]